MRRAIIALAVAITMLGSSAIASAGYIEYYRDNLFLGLAHHRIGCETDGWTITNDQDYDGFTNKRYCYAGDPWYGPQWHGADWYDWNYSGGKQQLDSCGNDANNEYGTYGYSENSSTCGYNIWCNCNSDCWIREFSGRQGWTVGIASPCCDHWYCGCF